MSDNYNPTFIGADTAVMYIYGSLELKANMNYQYTGILLFDQFEDSGDLPDSITTAGQIIPDLYFQGCNDVVYLKDDLNLTDVAGLYYNLYCFP